MILSGISSLNLKLKYNPLKATITNFVFKLHYKITVLLLIVSVILVWSKGYFSDDNIKCISDNGVPDDITDTYCYFIGTFTIVRHYNEKLLQSGNLPHPGVGPQLQTDDIIVHNYYQWVPLVLLLQSVCFYVPYSIWKKHEGGKIKSIVEALYRSEFIVQEHDLIVNGQVIPSRSTLDKRLDTISRFIFMRLRVSRHWSRWLVIMEVVNLVHLMIQIWLTNLLLDGQFIGLGPLIVNGNLDLIADPLEFIFPKVTKCIFQKYGPSGTVQIHDILCVMGLNVINEKIFCILWFWYLFLLILSIIAVIWRFATFCLYRNNELFMKVAASFFWNPNASEMMKTSARAGDFKVFKVLEFGDWLFLYYLAKNINGFIFKELFRVIFLELQIMHQSTSTLEVDVTPSGSAAEMDNFQYVDDNAINRAIASPSPSKSSDYYDASNNVRLVTVDIESNTSSK